MIKSLPLNLKFTSLIVCCLVFGLNIQAKKKAKTSNEFKEIMQSGNNQSFAMPNKIRKHSVGIGVGQTFLKGDFKDSGDDEITIDLLYNYSASHSFDFMANLHYSTHSHKKQQTEISALTLGFKAKAYQFDAFSPFVMAGLGVYNPTVKSDKNGDGVLVNSKSKITFGNHLGLGADLTLNEKVTVGLLTQVHNPFDVKQDDDTTLEGSYFKMMMTAYYTF